MEKKVIVFAQDNCIKGKGEPAGRIPVPVGSTLTITCSDTDEWEIRTGDERFEVNANGKRGDMPYNPGPEHATMFYGTLVGSFDGGTTYFSVGTHLVMTVNYASPDGGDPILTLWCWDSYSEDNSGAISATVLIEP